MDAMEVLMTRSSVRRFTDRPVEPAVLMAMLRAAMQAPSADNQQPWHFVVVTRKDLLVRMPEAHPSAGMLLEAPAAVLVCAHPGLERVPGMWFQDCAAATENLLLAAHAQGLGATWVGVYPYLPRMERIREVLDIPPNIEPFALVALGYPAGPFEQEDRFHPQRVHWNTWRGKEPPGGVPVAFARMDQDPDMETWLNSVSVVETPPLRY